MSTEEVELDEDLLEQAAATSKPRSEVIAEALCSQLGGGRLREILTSARKRSGLSGQQAMKVAVSELDAYRDQQTLATARGDSAPSGRCRSQRARLCGDLHWGATAAVIDLINAGVILTVVSPMLLAEPGGVLCLDKFRDWLDLEHESEFVSELERLAEIADRPAGIRPVSSGPMTTT